MPSTGTTRVPRQPRRGADRPPREGRAASGPSRLRLALCVYVVLLVAASAASLQNSISVPSTVGSILMGLCPAFACLIRAYRLRGRPRMAWALIGLGMLSNAFGDVAFGLLSLGGESPSGLSVADPFYLATYPLLCAGVVALLMSCDGVRARDAIIDGATVATVAGLVIWQLLVVNPGVASEGGLATRVVFSLYPLADTLVVAILVALLLSAIRRDRAVNLLIFFALGFLASDVFFNVIGVTGADELQGVSSVLYFLSYSALVGVGFLPVGAGGRSAESEPHPAHFSRLVLLGGALAGAPALSILAAANGFRLHVPVYLAAAALVGVTVMARMTMLVLGLESERSNLRRAERELAHQATHDLLTGLANRGAVVSHLEDVLARSGASGRRVGVLFVDLDDFKVVNDSFGHQSGDALLVHVAARIDAVVGPQGLVARLGGDEFVVVCDITDNEDAAELLASLIISALATPVDIGGGATAFTNASVGVRLQLDGDDATAMLRDADIALYEAKEAGKRCARKFDEGMRARVAERQAIESGLRESLDRGLGLRVVYQPRVHIESETVVGVEALARWRDTDGADVSPALFIPIAENAGVIDALGAWVFDRACSDITRLNDAAVGVSPIGVAVNLSVRQLMQPGLVSEIAAVLDRTGIDPGLVTLELTETFLAEDPAAAARTLARLRALGVRLEVDDFGVGYSSLARLSGFPLDGVKIDRSFVGDLDRERSGESVVTAIIALAAALELEITAEGVETREQAQWLLRNGCELAQGFYFHRPLELAEVAAVVGVQWLAPVGEPGCEDRREASLEDCTLGGGDVVGGPTKDDHLRVQVE